MIAAVVGSREFKDEALVDRVVRGLFADGKVVTIISGGAPGADSLVREGCRKLGVHFCLEDKSDPYGLKHLPMPHHFCEIKAMWRGPDGKGPYNPRAGYERNARLVQHASMVIALYAPGPLSPGTTHTVNLAKAAGLPTHIFHEGRWDAA